MSSHSDPPLASSSYLARFINRMASFWPISRDACSAAFRVTGNEAGASGLVTLNDSNWFLSIVMAHEPRFVDQPRNFHVC
jgi:hypothetical protein